MICNHLPPRRWRCPYCFQEPFSGRCSRRPFGLTQKADGARTGLRRPATWPNKKPLGPNNQPERPKNPQITAECRGLFGHAVATRRRPKYTFEPTSSNTSKDLPTCFLSLSGVFIVFLLTGLRSFVPNSCSRSPGRLRSLQGGISSF